MLEKLVARKNDLGDSKSEVHRLDIAKPSQLAADQLKPVLTGLKKLSDLAKNVVVKEMIMILRSKLLSIKYLVLLN